MSAILKIDNEPLYTHVALKLIRAEHDVQSREKLDTATVDEYAEHAESLPAVDVYWDGEAYWLADGFHRHAAWSKAKLKEVPVIIRRGGKREALYHSLGSNKSHGLRRSNADKRHAASAMLRDEEWRGMSDHAIAEHLGVSQTFISNLRRETYPEPLKTVFSQDRIGKDGRKINTASVGGKSTGRPPKTKPTAYFAPGTEDTDFGEPADEFEAPAPAPPPKPGRTRVNGVEQDDPPEIAELRAAGKIGPDTIPEVTTHEPEPEPESLPEPEPTEEPDEDWLASLPARSKIAPAMVKVFDADALAFRKLESHRKTFQHRARRMAKGNGAYAYRVRRFVTTDHPKHWLACPAVEYGGCDGTGTVEMIGQCQKCHGRGYYIR